MRIVEEKVKPYRLAQNRESRQEYWWRFGETTPGLFEALTPLRRVLAGSQVTAHFGLGFLIRRLGLRPHLQPVPV